MWVFETRLDAVDPRWNTREFSLTIREGGVRNVDILWIQVRLPKWHGFNHFFQDWRASRGWIIVRSWVSLPLRSCLGAFCGRRFLLWSSVSIRFTVVCWRGWPARFVVCGRGIAVGEVSICSGMPLLLARSKSLPRCQLGLFFLVVLWRLKDLLSWWCHLGLSFGDVQEGWNWWQDFPSGQIYPQTNLPGTSSVLQIYLFILTDARILAVILVRLLTTIFSNLEVAMSFTEGEVLVVSSALVVWSVYFGRVQQFVSI